MGFAPAPDFVTANSDGCWDRLLLLHILPVPASSSNLPQASRQPEHCFEFKDTTFLGLNPGIPACYWDPAGIAPQPCLAPKGSSTAPSAQGLFLCGDKGNKEQRCGCSPGRCSWQKCQPLPHGWSHGWLDRNKWPLPSLNQCVPPDRASWPCPGQRGTQHFVLAGKEELKKRGSGSQRCPGDAELPALCLWWWWWC